MGTFTSFTDLQGNTIKLKAGIFAVRFDEKNGYSIAYQCDNAHPECTVVIGA